MDFTKSRLDLFETDDVVCAIDRHDRAHGEKDRVGLVPALAVQHFDFLPFTSSRRRLTRTENTAAGSVTVTSTVASGTAISEEVPA